MHEEAFIESIQAGARAMGVDLSALQVDSMVLHARELLAWNVVVNLTRMTDVDALAEKQFLDVIPLCKEIPEGARVLDVGSGGGFPGIPLKVLRSDLSVTLIDGRRKKVSFLKHVIRALKLEGLQARQVRAEDIFADTDNKGDLFDVVIAKAVGDLRGLIHTCLPLLKNSGKFIAMKGVSVEEEWAETGNDIVLEGVKIRKVSYRLPVSGIDRTLVILEGCKGRCFT